MSNVKLNILEDEDGNDISGELNNVEQTLGRIGIALRKSPTEWNNFGSVLDQLSVKWKELSSVDQSAIATALGGVRQKEAVLTMMENYDKVLQYEKTAMESSGTALEKFNNAYLGSIEAKTNAFKASFESFSMSIINSNVLKTITDIGSATLSWLDGTDRLIPTFYRVLGVATAIGVVLKRNALAGGISNLIQYGGTIGAFGSGGVAGLNALTTATQGLSKARLMSVITTNKLSVAEASKLLIGNGVERQERISILTKLGYIKTQDAQTISTNAATVSTGKYGLALKGAFASLKAFLSTPVGAAMLIAGSIFLISRAIKALDKTTAEAMEKFSQESSKYEENKTSLEGVNSELKTTKDRIAEINAIPLKTLAEQDELDNLEEKNKKLQIQYDLLLAQSKLLESNKAQAGAEVYSSLNKTGEGWGFGNRAPSGYSSTGKRLTDLTYLEKMGTPFSTGGADALPMALEGYKSAQKEMESIADKDSNRYKKLQKDLSDYSSSIQEISAAYQAVLESYVKGTPQYTEAEKALSEVSVTLGTATTKSEKYSEVISKYSSAKSGLEELSAANKLNVESVSELVSKYPALKSELDSIGVSVEQLVTEFATAPDPIAEMNQSISDLKTTMDGLPERMEDLESINKKVSDGYHFSITEIDEILKKYPQLESAVTRTAHGFQIASGAIDTLSTGVSFTTGEIEQLEKVHGTLKYTVDETTGLVYIEKTSLDSLGASATQLKINLARAQIEMNQAAILGATSRIKAIEAEISAIGKLNQATLNSYQIAKNERDELRAEKSRNSLISQNTVGQANLDNLIAQLDSYQSELDRIGTGSVSGYTPEKGKTAEELLEEEKKLQRDAFEAQKAIIDRQLALNLITEEQYTNSLESLYKQFYSDKSKYLDEYTQYEIEVYNKRQGLLEQAQKDLESLHKATMDMIKQEMEEKKKALEKQKDNLKEEKEAEEKALEKKKDNLKEYTDARKKALEDARDQDAYDKQVREKSKDIESIKAQLLGLSGDMSGAGMRKKTELKQALVDAQDELSQTVSDRQYDSQIDAIDSAYETQEKIFDAQIESINSVYEAQEKMLDSQIESIDSFLDNQSNLVQEAFNRMNGMSATLKSQLIAYNQEYGSGISNDIVKNWDAATEALMRYGSVANTYGTLTTITTSIGRPPTGYASGTSGLKRDSIIVGTHELLLNKTGENAYQMMNAGSPIFTEQQTNALKALLSSPSSLLTKTVGGVGLNNASTIMSMVNSNNSPSIEINYEMNISGTDPQGIKLALAKEMPKFSDYVLNKINKDVQFSKGVRLTAANMA